MRRGNCLQEKSKLKKRRKERVGERRGNRRRGERGAGRRGEEKWRGEGGVRCDSTNYIVRTVILDSISSV